MTRSSSKTGDRRTDAVRAVRTVTGLSLAKSKVLLDGAPVTGTGPVWLEAARDAAGVLAEAGVHATVECDWWERTVATVGGPLDPASCAGRWWPAAACRASNPSSVGKAENVEDAIG
ncbi:Ribosomal protein L7/L12 C-terminal domain-containing protein [Streptomyces sp. 1222.5]|uniref:ribosomal protein L7/L12 n=1 Tax=unclassified Streptomyces TaxID=2593676 RepID=UPI00089A9180|nr:MULTISPECIES: ribosomal protein L7/L12 [unclassified Streptomyces]PKW12495.1 ribosomal L7/L12-like protein [Streptomyces sp. 5112.2]SEB55403.1 Ribosomal protein L7/L12 C-terminal domain-containing protein [Streptomyces sp. 1222.5]